MGIDNNFLLLTFRFTLALLAFRFTLALLAFRFTLALLACRFTLALLAFRFTLALLACRFTLALLAFRFTLALLAFRFPFLMDLLLAFLPLALILLIYDNNLLLFPCRNQRSYGLLWGTWFIHNVGVIATTSTATSSEQNRSKHRSKQRATEPMPPGFMPTLGTGCAARP